MGVCVCGVCVCGGGGGGGGGGGLHVSVGVKRGGREGGKARRSEGGKEGESVFINTNTFAILSYPLYEHYCQVCIILNELSHMEVLKSISLWVNNIHNCQCYIHSSWYKAFRAVHLYTTHNNAQRKYYGYPYMDTVACVCVCELGGVNV